MKDFFKKYFLPDGRIGRKSFLLGGITGFLCLVIVYVFFVLFLKLLYNIPLSVTFLVIGKITMGMILLFAICAFGWFIFCQGAQRIHDLNK